MSKTNRIYILAAVGIFLLSFVLIAFTPLKKFIPGYPDEEFFRQQELTAMRVDSLEKCIFRWELYSENLSRIFSGQKPVQIDSLLRLSEFKSDAVAGKEKADSILRDYVRSREQKGVSRSPELENLHFFKPLTGTVSHHFEVAGHPYIDVTAPEGTAVKAVLDGSVLYTDWTETDNWTIIIQHDNGVISVFKHCQKPLKDVSDKVSAGTSVALLGSDPASGDARQHLHFELWKDGTPLDPTLYINF